MVVSIHLFLKGPTNIHLEYKLYYVRNIFLDDWNERHIVPNVNNQDRVGYHDYDFGLSAASSPVAEECRVGGEAVLVSNR